MILRPQDFVDFFKDYASAPSPATTIHSAVDANNLFTEVSRYGNAAKEAFSAKRLGAAYAKLISYSFCFGAAAFSAAFKPIDLVVGTGRQQATLPKSPTSADFRLYLVESASHPTDTGMLGAVVGLKFGLCAGTGAAIGALVGAVFGVVHCLVSGPQPGRFKQAVMSGAADGASVFALNWLITTGFTTVPVVGAVRLVSGIIKGTGACLVGCALAVTAGILAAPALLYFYCADRLLNTVEKPALSN